MPIEQLMASGKVVLQALGASRTGLLRIGSKAGPNEINLPVQHG